jgi:integrase
MAQGRIYKRGSTWSYRIDGPIDPGSGKRRQISKGGFRTKRDAENALSAVKYELDTGQHVRRSRLTVGEYLEGWLPSQTSRLAPSTVKSYRTAVGRLDRHLGKLPLQSLTPETVEQLHEDLREEGLSPKSGLNTHHVLQAALRDAARRGLVFQNVASVAQTPPNTREAQPVLSTSELEVLIDAIHDPTMKAIVQVVSRTGLRRGELVALRYNDIDLDKRTIRVDSSLTSVGGGFVEGPPKTRGSRRVVAIDDETVEVLRTHRQLTEERRAQLEMGPLTDDDYVFTRPNFVHLHPDGLSNQFTRTMVRIAAEHEITPITFHGLRHTHATHCLEAEIHPKAVAERLGHSSVTTTLDLYSHITEATSAAVADQLSRYLAGDNPSIDSTS